MNQTMNQERTAKLTIILGTNGTGKTTLLKNILMKSNDRSLVITPDDIEWQHLEPTDLISPDDFLFSGNRRHIWDPAKKTGTLDKLEFFYRGIIVFDDCRAYLQSSTDDRIRQLLIRRRQRMVDVFAVGHGFNEVPPVFFTFATDIILFRTTDNIIRRKNCLKNYDEMVKAQVRINRKAEKEPHYFEHLKLT